MLFLTVKPKNKPDTSRETAKLHAANLCTCNKESQYGFELYYQNRWLVEIDTDNLYRTEPGQPIKFNIIRQYYVRIACEVNSFDELVKTVHELEPKTPWYKQIWYWLSVKK